MAENNAFGLGPLDRLIAEYEQQLGNMPGIGQSTAQDTPEIDARRPTPAPSRARGLLPPVDMVPVFEAASQKYDVPVNILMALAQQESSYNAGVRGVPTQYGRALGLMQYLPSTAKMMGINPFDAEQSVDAAARQLKERLDKGYSMEDAVREHFAGPDRRGWGPKTAQYGIDVINKARQIGAEMYGEDAAPAGIPNMRRNPFLTEGNMSTRQDGPMSVPAGTDTRDLPAIQTPDLQSAAQAEDYESRSWFDRYVGDRLKSGWTGLRAGFAANLAEGDARIIRVIDRIDRGEDVPDIEDPLGYQHMDAERRAKTKDDLAKNFLENIGTVADLRKQQAQIPQHPEVQAALQSKSFSEFWDHFKKAPVTFIANVGVESAPAMAPGLLAGGVLGIGLRAGAAGFAAGMGAGSYAVDYQASILEALGDLGVDPTNREALEKAFRNPETMEQVRKLAHAHASVVGTLDAASGAVAGKAIIGGKTVARRVANAAAQMPVQGTLGAAGEAGGQLAQGKTDLEAGQIAAEFLGEAVTAPVDVAGALLSRDRARTSTSGNVSTRIPGRAKGPLGRAVEAGEAEAAARRVVVTAPDGATMSGFLDAYDDDGSGGFVARVIGDDGVPYSFKSADGVSIVPESQAGVPALPAPTITVDAAGNAATTEQRQQRTERDQAAAEANRVRREQLGMTPDQDRAAQAQRERERLPESLKADQPISVVTRDGEVIDGTVISYKRTKDGAALEFTDEAGNEQRLTQDQFSEIIEREASDAATADSQQVSDGSASSPAPAGTKRGGQSRKGKADAPRAATSGAPAGEVGESGTEGVAGANRGRVAERPLEPDLSAMPLADLVKHREYLSNQARTNGGWSKPLSREKRRVEAAIRKIDPAAMDQFKTPKERKAAEQAPQVSPSNTSTAVPTPRATDITTPQGKPLVELFHPASGTHVLVRKDQWEAGKDRLVLFNRGGTRKVGPGQEVARTALAAPVEAAPSVAPGRSESQRVEQKANEAQPLEQQISEFVEGKRETAPDLPVPAKPRAAGKEDLDHLFGVDQKRTKALERIAKGQAWFGDQKKARDFITKNGLADTHTVEQTGAKRFEVKAKPAGEQTIAEGMRVAVVSKRNGNVVDRGIYRGDNPRTGSAKIEIAPGSISMRHRDDYEIQPIQQAVTGDDAGARSTYTLPERKVSDDWNDTQGRGPQNPQFKPSARQQLVIDATRQAVDEGLFYNNAVQSRVAEILNVDADALARNETGVQGGDFGYDIYHARQYLDAQRDHTRRQDASREMALEPGDKLGVLRFNDFKYTSAVEVVSVDGNTVKLRGKRGPQTVEITTEAAGVAAAMDRAHEGGKRKDGSQAWKDRKAQGAAKDPQAPSDTAEPNLEAARKLLQEQREATGNKRAESNVKRKIRALAKKTPVSDERTVMTLDMAATRLNMDGLEFADAAPADTGAAQWNELTPAGRRDAMKRAGVSLPDRVTWENISEANRKKLRPAVSDVLDAAVTPSSSTAPSPNPGDIVGVRFESPDRVERMRVVKGPFADQQRGGYSYEVAAENGTGGVIVPETRITDAPTSADSGEKNAPKKSAPEMLRDIVQEQRDAAIAAGGAQRWNMTPPAEREKILAQPGGWGTAPGAKNALSPIGRRIAQQGWSEMQPGTRDTVRGLIAKFDGKESPKKPVTVSRTPGVTTIVIDPSAMSPDPVAPTEQEVAPEPKPADDRFAGNKIFTADKVAKARARLRSKLNQLNSGIDPEVMLDGIIITGAYLESGVRDFSAYAKEMMQDMGEAVKPYLLSFYEGARNYPGLDTKGMSSVEDAARQHAAMTAPIIEAAKATDDVRQAAKDAGISTAAGIHNWTQKESGKASVKIAVLNSLYVSLPESELIGAETLADEIVAEIATMGDAAAAIGTIAKKPARRSRKTGAKADMTLTQDWGVDHIDGYSDDADRETGNTVKDAFMKEARSYLNTVAGILTENGYTPHTDAKGRPEKPVRADESGVAGSGDITLTLAGPDGVGVYVHIGDTVLRGVVPTTPSGVAIMFRAAQNGDKYGVKGTNQWAPVDLSAADFAALVDAHVKREAKSNERPADAQDAGIGVQEPSAQGVPANEEPGTTGDLFGQPDRDGDAVDIGGDGSSDTGVGADRRLDEARAAHGNGAQGGRGSGAVAGAGRTAAGAGRGRERAARTDDAGRTDRGLLAREDAARDGRPVSAPRNYRIQTGELTRQGSWKDTAARNVEIVELVKRLDAENRQATPEEKALLTRFTGWGASEIANGIFPDRHGNYKPGWQELGERLKAALTDQEYANARRSTQYAHYTSEGVIRSIFNGLDRLGFKGGEVVEPGMGIGLFAGLMPDVIAANSTYTGIEFDAITGAIAKHLYPASNIIVGDYTRTNLPANYFDAAIGNPPFSSTVITNDPEYKRHRFMLHDYFFAKTIDRVRPGGLVVFVTSKGTMDKASDKARKYLAQRANLVGAVRLPQTAFKGNAGTEVVTDVLFLQKKGAGVEDNGVSWLGLKEVKTNKGEATPVNEYFADHPEMVLGEHALTGSMYRANEYTVEPRAGEDIEQAFAQAVQRLPEDIYNPERGTKADTAKVIERDFNPTNRKEGGLYLSEDGTLMQVDGGSGVPVTQRKSADGKKMIDLTPKQVAWLKDYVGLRDALKAAQHDQLTDGDWQASMANLNTVYDAFVKKHGQILAHTVIERENEDGTTSVTLRFKNKALWEMDAEGALVHGLEHPQPDGSITKGPVLFERVLRKPVEPEIKTTQDAMFVSLNNLGRLDIDDVAKLAGLPREEVIDTLGTAIYEDPGEGWQTADEYLSGNVVRKLEQARAAADLNPKYKRNVDALLAVQPRPLGPTDITVRLGANWVPASDIEAFAQEVLGERIEVIYTPITGDWSASGRGSVAGSEWTAGDMSASQILHSVLNSRQLKVTYKDGEGKTHTDPVATEKANDVAQKMKDAFTRWIWTDPNRADRLTKYYNENFNNIAPRQYDGSHLTLPGVSMRFTLHPHQKRAVWRIIQDGDVYLAHAVGSGKFQSLDAKLLTPTGWIRMGDVKVGDYVITQSGKPTRVEAVYPQGEKEIFKVTFSDGSVTDSGDEHLWLTWTYKERMAAQRAAKLGKDWPSAQPKVRELSEIRKTLVAPHLGAKNHSIPMVGIVDFDARDVPLDPYLLGALIGDGSFTHSAVTFTKDDREIVYSFGLPDGCRLTERDYDDGKCIGWAIVGTGPRNPVLDALRDIGLQGLSSAHKFVPEVYKFNSPDVRLAVLHGLMDTDGWVENKGRAVCFSTSSPQLADDVTFLVRSFGGTVGRSIKHPKYTYKGEVKAGLPAYCLSICMPPEINPFHTSRKASKVVPKTKYQPVRYIVDVQSMGMKPAQCIRVADASHLYVTDDFIVTHNTIEMIAGGMEQRRLGLISKPIYTVPNHMLAQFASEFLELYPTAHIMVADEQNFHTSNRRRFLAQAALNNPDAIIITHSAFGRLGMSDEYADAFIQRQIDEWKAALDDVDNSDRITKKQIERRIEQLEKRLEGKQAKDTKDRVLTFEELGADYLFVDEMHEFRKLDFATNQGNIKGIDPTGSQRALDLFMKVEYLRGKNPGRSITGASGTPITNTMGELFTVQRFFQPEQLAEDGLDTFDAWAAQYGDTVTALEQNAAGGYETVTRFAKFQNVPELMHRVRSFMDIVTNTKLGELVKRPNVRGGARQIVVTPSPSGYREYQKVLEERIKAIRARTGPPEPGDDIILTVINDGRFSAMDMRFVDPTLPPDPDSKLNRMLDDLIEAYRATADNEYETDGVPDPLKGSTLLGFSDIGLGEQAAKRRGFSMHDWILQRLTDAGIPREHIAFMRDYKQHAKKGRLFADMRDGKRRILIGGKDMETGVNVQKRLTHIFHLDAPWFPSSVEQREGRGVRQGNQNAEVDVRAYATKGSYDSTMWGMNARKARFIEQAMNGDDSLRSLEDVSEASSFELAAALASGDERYLKLAGLRGDVERLSRLRQAHYDGQSKMRRDRHWAESEVERKTKQLAEYKAAIEKRIPIVAGEFAGKVGKTTFDSREDFSNALFDAFKKLVGAQADKTEVVGEIGGFSIRFDGLRGEKSYVAEISVDVPGGEPILSWPIDEGMAINGLATKAANQVNGLDRRVTLAEQDISNAQRKIEQIDARFGAPFAEEAELLDKIAQLNDLEAELAAESSEAESAQVAEQAQAEPPSDISLSVVDQTETPAFKRWFGDSKVVDADGKPLVVYHGTTSDFDAFDPDAEPFYYASDRGKQFFLSNPEGASGYAIGTFDVYGGNPSVLPVYLRIENPRIENVSGSPSDWWDSQPDYMWSMDVERQGHDGLIVNGDDETMFVTTSPTQIKSATGNRGTFDPGNPDITYSVSADGADIGLSQRGTDIMRGQTPIRVRSTAAQRDMPVDQLRTQAFAALRDERGLNNPDIGQIAINRAGWSKSRANSADRAKLLSLSALPEIIRDGAYLGSRPTTKDRAVAYHYIGQRVSVDGVPLVALVTVQEHADGSLTYYNHTLFTDPFAGTRATGNVDSLLASYRRPAFTPDRQRTRAQSLPITHERNHRALLDGALGGLVDTLIGTGHIVLHPNESALPTSIRLKGGAAVQGWTDRDTGIIHLVAESLTPQTAQPVLMHEALHGHGERLLGTPKWNRLMRRGETLRKAAERRRTAGQVKDGNFWDGALRRLDAARAAGAVSEERLNEEFAAYAIEEYELAPSGVKKWVDALIGAIKDWLFRRFGIQAGQVTPAQLRAMALVALRSLEGTAPVQSQAMGGHAFGGMAMSAEDRFFVNEVMAELAAHDGFFRYPVSRASTLSGVADDIGGGLKYVGVEPILESDQADHYGALRIHRLGTAERNPVRVFEDDERVWLDVSRLDPGEGGARVYAAVANYAYNTGRTFIGDPDGLSDAALYRRTEAMLNSALKFGTTRHLEPHEYQLRGNSALGVPPLKWQNGDDAENVRSMIDVVTKTIENNAPEAKGLHFDFASRTFRTGEGQPVTDELLGRWVAAGEGRTLGIGRTSLERNGLYQTLLRSTGSERPGLLERILRTSTQLVESGAPLNRIGYSTREREGALNEATEALDTDTDYLDFEGLPDASGSAIRDMTSRYMKYVAHPRHIAALHRDFVPVFKAANDQQHDRNATLEDLHKDFKAYDKLKQASKERVNRILELGRLMGEVYSEAALYKGVTNTGFTKTVVRDEKGEPHLVRQPIQAALSKAGDVITLNAAEQDAYRALRRMFDRALDKFRDQALVDFGFGEYAGKKNPLDELRALVKDKPKADAQANRIRNIIQFIEDIEQSKRAGYVPFSRYGDYVIAVKERIADLKYRKMGDGYLVRGVTPELDEVLERMGATYDSEEHEWYVSEDQRIELERANERTLYSEKVETGLRDKFGKNSESKVKKREAKVENIPSVKAARARIEQEYIDGHAGRRIVAFETTKKRGEGGIDLSALDALAEVAQIDNPTWDAVRGELQKALQAGGFRRHFFQSSHVPGYTTDFQRAIADYMVGMSGYLARRRFSDAWDKALSMIKGAALHEYATKYRAYFNDPREEFAMLRQAAFVMKIGANISSALVNLTQTFLTTIPTLNQIAGNATVAAELAKASKDALAMFTPKAGTNVFDMSRAPADLREEFARADAAGLFLPLNSFDLMGQANQRSAAGRRTQKIANTATSAISLPFSASERFNRIIAFTVAARLAKRAGMAAKIRNHFKNDAWARDSFGREFTPYDFAEWLAQETQFQMGKINRPTAMRGAGAAMLQFKSFMMQLLEKMYRDWTLHGAAGKVSTISTLAMMIAFSGLLGAPGTDDLRKLLEFFYKQASGKDVDLKDALRQTIYGATGSMLVTDALSSGIPYYFGLDLSQRVGLGNILPEQYNRTGLDMLDAATMVGGPGFDILVAAPIRAMGLVSAGNIPAAIGELAPVWAKNPLQAYQWHTDAVRTKRGDKVLDRSEISGADIALKLIGVQPSRVSRQYEMSSAQFRAQRGSDDAKRALRLNLVRAIERRSQNKDTDRKDEFDADVKAAADKIREWNRSAPNDQRISLKPSSIRTMLQRERLGGQSVIRRAPRASRRDAVRRAEAYGLGLGR